LVEVLNVGQSNLSILISLLVFLCYYIWICTNCDMRFINFTCKIVRWTCSSVRGSNEPSKPIRIKKIHSHLTNIYNVYYIQLFMYGYHKLQSCLPISNFLISTLCFTMCQKYTPVFVNHAYVFNSFHLSTSNLLFSIPSFPICQKIFFIPLIYQSYNRETKWTSINLNRYTVLSDRI
jgi:hypothetical protein